MSFWEIDATESLTGLELKKFLNKKRIIKYLYRNSLLSGADITKILHLSTPTAIAYLNELIDEGYVEIRGKGDSIGGRRPNMYGLKKNSVYVLGIDVGRTFLDIGIFNNDLEKVSGVSIRQSLLTQPDALIQLIVENTFKLFADSAIDRTKVMGIGITMPGLIDSAKGINYTYLNMGETSLAEFFEQKFKRPVFIENDAKARTLAEHRYGALKDKNNAIVLQIDWGLGLGLFLNGKLYRGNSGFAGEFSHIPIEPNGVLCNCGKIGCLETVASGNALVRFAVEGLEQNQNSGLYQILKGGTQLIPGDIIDAANSGDQFAITVINKVGINLGKGISYLIQILNPELVVLGGSVARAEEYLITPIKQSLYKHCLPKLREDANIIVSPLGKEMGVIGAATVVIEHILENN